MSVNNPDAKWFNDRPTRTEKCPRCAGCGVIPIHYALYPTDDPVIDAPNDAIRASVIGSFDIFTACREALVISIRSGERVAFRFLDHTVVVSYVDDSDEVARVWWQKQYNETPEQSRARR